MPEPNIVRGRLEGAHSLVTQGEVMPELDRDGLASLLTEAINEIAAYDSLRSKLGEEVERLREESNRNRYGRATLHRLCFRPERSRPIWRNKHTGTEVTVIDLLVNDDGGFQGGCRQFYVQTDESQKPGPLLPPSSVPPGHPLDAFLAHWEPTGKSVPVDEISKLLPEEGR